MCQSMGTHLINELDYLLVFNCVILNFDTVLETQTFTHQKRSLARYLIEYWSLFARWPGYQLSISFVPIALNLIIWNNLQIL